MSDIAKAIWITAICASVVAAIYLTSSAWCMWALLIIIFVQ